MDMPGISSNKFIKYCGKMEQILYDNNECKEAFLRATNIIDKVVNEKYDGNYDRSIAKTVLFSKYIKNVLS